jgi:hypothetical protein
MHILDNSERIQFCNNYLLDSNDGFMKSLNLSPKESRDLILTQNSKSSILNNLASKDLPRLQYQSRRNSPVVLSALCVLIHKLALQKSKILVINH